MNRGSGGCIFCLALLIWVVSVVASGCAPQAVQTKPESIVSEPKAFAEAKPPEVKVGPYKPGEVWREPVAGIEFVWVPGGCYQMGCGDWAADHCEGDALPVHEVCVDGVWMSRGEITQAQWQKVMKSNPSKFKGGGNCPVEQVSWEEARDFADQLGKLNGGKDVFRLPTEAEWEYACRSGGKTERYAGGDAFEAVAWFYANCHQPSCKPQSKKSNSLGLYNMSGNVWEWVEDAYERSAYKAHAQLNPMVESDDVKVQRVLRGGGFVSLPLAVTCGHRGKQNRDFKYEGLGFRLAKNP